MTRIKNISVLDEREGTAPKQVEISTDQQSVPDRNLTHEKVKKITELHFEDPLVYNTSVLSRVFKIDERYCKEVVKFVRPLVYYGDSSVDEAKRLIKGAIVIDVDRLVSDEGYLMTYKRIVFPTEEKERQE